MTTYRSTRGGASGLRFGDVLLEGLAPDGGLYLPDAWPVLDDVAALAGQPFERVARAVLSLFAPDLPEDDVAFACAAYGRDGAFVHPGVAPLVQTGPDDWTLELFRGPTLAFKDVAMQALGRLFERRLAAEGRRMTVVAATSGDTGGAAVAALAGLPSVDLVVLHPKGRISEVQRRFMTTAGASNVANVAVRGTFDDCQAAVKAMFADEGFRDEVSLGAVNSINWARIVAQSVYYVTSSLLLAGTGRAPSYVVPTGNFGDVFAGLVARRMGAPVGRLIVATNENDILDRAMRTGDHAPRAVSATPSPSMDIQVSSNFERLLYEASDGDEALVRDLMGRQARGEGFTLPDAMRARIASEFASYRASEAEAAAQMRRGLAETGEAPDPHTGVGLAAAAKARADGLTGPLITLATAHAAKFPGETEAATGTRPALPARLSGLMDAEEDYAVLDADLGALMAFVRAQVRR